MPWLRTLTDLRSLFTKSVVARADLPAGTVLTETMLSVKKPGTGIPAARFSKLMGLSLRRPVRANEVLTLDDFDVDVRRTLA